MNEHNSLEVAVIGLSGRFPKAQDLAQFWENVRNGVEAIEQFTDEELLQSGVNPSLLQDRNYVRAGTVLEAAEYFDAAYFGISPLEAKMMDPQHRLLLECAQEALEDAGYDPQRYQKPIGVFAGAGKNTYLGSLPEAQGIAEALGAMQTAIANGNDFVATRLSYKLNLRGPGLTIQTACSTSLVTVHLACQSLLSGDCDLALAGGVAVGFPQKRGYLYQEGSILSPDGHCRPFDAKAKGTVPSRGCGLVVLKRLDEAISDRDTIYAVIKGSAINNDGSGKIGFTAPDISGQTRVIRAAQIAAGVGADTITLIEAHGTGTELGDPIEIAALTEAFRASTDKTGFCAVGSLKSNIGHADAAAGVGGLIKAILALKHKEIPPSLHFERANSKIDFVSSPFYVNTRLEAWKAGQTPRRAGVSSFGIGGTNAHVVLEEAPEIAAGGESRAFQLVLLSARTETALDTACKNLAGHVRKTPELDVADLAYTLQVGRRGLEHRRMFLCRDRGELLSGLERAGQPQTPASRVEPGHRPVVFMFPGQGSQHANMGRGQYETEPAFRSEVDRCCERLIPRLGYDLRTILYPENGREEVAAQKLQQTAVTQPALFVTEHALARLWMSWGIQPEALTGHSIGEYVAACLAGVFTLEDALDLVVERGRLMQATPAGAMLAVPLSEAELLKRLTPGLSIAAVNGPSLCVVSGPVPVVDGFVNVLEKSGVTSTRLHTSHAFHSEMMDPVLRPFAECVGRVKRGRPRIPFLSNLTGTWISESEATDPEYWAKHLRHTVRYAAGIAELFKDPDRVLLEVGPGTTLSSLARQQVKSPAKHLVLSSLRHPRDQISDVAALVGTLGQLWLAGKEVDWPGFYRHERRRHVGLPTYPFERQRYSLDGERQARREANGPVSTQRKPDLADWFYLPSWKRSELPARAGGNDQPVGKLGWLVFMEEGGLGSRLVSKLRSLGHDVVEVFIGSGYERIIDGKYRINPQRRSDYQSLVGDLLAAQKLARKILHLWSVSTAQKEEDPWASLEQSQYLGLHSLLFLVQAFGEHNLTANLEIEVVSNHVQTVTGEELISPGKATVLGGCKVIPLEYPNIKCRSIDIEMPTGEGAVAESLVDQLLAEFMWPPSEVILAYRGQYRWVETFEPVRLEKTGETAPRLKKNGIYLVSGGLGGMGLSLAEFLGTSVQAKLVLVSRSPLPDRNEWPEWVAVHGAQDEVSRKIQKLQRLEAGGAEIMTAAADVSNLEQMRAVVANAIKRFGRIDGVVHAAGLADYAGIIQRRTQEATEAVLAPKVRGTLVLDKLLGQFDLDFFVLCSSLGDIFYEVKFGQVGYAAANEFLDAFPYCKKSNRRGLTATINWDDWKEVGMSEAARSRRAIKEQFAVERALVENSLSVAEGTEIFNRVLSYRYPRVITSVMDLQAYRGLLRAKSGNGGASGQAGRASAPRQPRRAKNVEFVKPANEVEQSLARIWSELLGIEEVGGLDNFFELGGHSLLGAQMMSRVRKTLGVQLSPQSLYEAPTIQAMGVLVTQSRTQAAAETGKISSLLERVERLSAEEFKKLSAQADLRASK